MDKINNCFGEDGKFKQNTVIYNDLIYVSLPVYTDFGIKNEDRMCANCAAAATQKCELFFCLPNERADNTMVYYVLGHTEKMGIKKDIFNALSKKRYEQKEELRKAKKNNSKIKVFFKTIRNAINNRPGKSIK